MKPYTLYKNYRHHLMLLTGSQQGKTHRPYMAKLMSNIKNRVKYKFAE